MDIQSYPRSLRTVSLQVMRFWFAVPKAEKMAELTTLMTFVFAMVSQVGSYSISTERQKQAEQVGIGTNL